MNKKYKILLSLFIIIICNTLCICKWNTWFGEIGEEQYSIAQYRIDRILISMGENSDTDRSFSWRSDTLLRKNILIIKEVNSKDSLIVEGIGSKLRTKGGVSVIYRADVKNLKLDKTYSYYIQNKYYTSPSNLIRTSSTKDDYSFIYLGDIQDKRMGTSDSIINSINSKNPNVDFWAFGGDMIERPKDMYWDIWFKSVETVRKNTPIIACTGNHEYFKGLVKKLDKRWIHHFPLPKNGPINFKGRACYWNHKESLIVSLDTDGISGAISLYEQYTWLEKVLKESKAIWKILIMHHPVYSLRKSRLNVPSRYFFNNLFEKYSVDLVLQGHDHAYSRLINKDKKGKLTTPVYVVSSCSSKFYKPTELKKWDRMASCRKMYQTININGDVLEYKSYDCVTGYYDGVVINKATGLITEDKNLGKENINDKEKRIRR